MILALLIGISRIYVHVHYPTDIIGGIIVGIIGGLIATLLIDKVLYPKVIPFIHTKILKKAK